MIRVIFYYHEKKIDTHVWAQAHVFIYFFSNADIQLVLFISK